MPELMLPFKNPFSFYIYRESINCICMFKRTLLFSSSRRLCLGMITMDYMCSSFHALSCTLVWMGVGSFSLLGRGRSKVRCSLDSLQCYAQTDREGVAPSKRD